MPPKSTSGGGGGGGSLRRGSGPDQKDRMRAAQRFQIIYTYFVRTKHTDTHARSHANQNAHTHSKAIIPNLCKTLKQWKGSINNERSLLSAHVYVCVCVLLVCIEYGIYTLTHTHTCIHSRERTLIKSNASRRPGGTHTHESESQTPRCTRTHARLSM